MSTVWGQWHLNSDWTALLQEEFEQGYMEELRSFLVAETEAGKTLFPSKQLVFNALNSTLLNNVKVVILGQDPYHGPGQAHGLCFSVAQGVAPPPSLKNIFKEIHQDLGLPVPNHGCLQRWADQGVLLLNATLTVEQHSAGSHQRRGWEQFTDRVIEQLSSHCDGIVFLLWGSYAQKKSQLIDQRKHKILKAPHPSPLSAHRGFFGCKHFSQANAWLEAQGRTPIDWSV